MNVSRLTGILNTDRMAKIIASLEPAQQYMIGHEIGTPAHFASRIASTLRDLAMRPGNFETLAPSLQVQAALNKLFPSDSNMGRAGIADKLLSLSTAAIDTAQKEAMTPCQKVHSLIAESASAREGQRGPDVDNTLIQKPLSAETINRLTQSGQPKH